MLNKTRGECSQGGCLKYAQESLLSRNAMDNASKNAGDMIGSLTMQYNRGRQAAITNELVDIITGTKSMTMSCMYRTNLVYQVLVPFRSYSVVIEEKWLITREIYTCLRFPCHPREAIFQNIA